ncbi:polysaccharide deacetylase family protein [Saccharicrinis sp. FJH62]|uniref:polysaccharide deacetylase family protein n=1 Tax=Saccharicrinis sp. FJH62 TaxID=3344657 RepID=UPI0035D4F465
MLIERSPLLLQWVTPSLLWRVNTADKEVYLTFDDGPVPEVTPWVLDVLDQYDVKATFFCVGENVAKYPELFQKLQECGHSVGNHTYNHLKLYKTEPGIYRKNIQDAALTNKSSLFRPPHGQINRSMIQWLHAHKFKVVMWDVLPADYDKDRTGQQCFDTVKRKTRPGSIIVFHDSLKAQKNLMEALPLSIEYLLDQGWKFKTLI